MRLRTALALGLVAAAARAGAHAIDASTGDAVAFFTVEPWVLACLALSGGLYAVGLRRLWRQAGTGRGISRRQAAAFAGGWATLVVALVGPVDALGSRLFAAHMVQHELLMIVAAPLLVLGRPLAVWTWGLPAHWRPGVGGFFRAPAWRLPWRLATGPIAAWLLHAAALWLWHLPAAFDAALRHDGVHTVQHVSFLATALLFWWSVLGRATRDELGIALLSLFTTMVHTGALGALLTLSPVVWYGVYGTRALSFGLDALEDQQLGGLIMWIPAGLVYVVCALALARRWLGGRGPTPPLGAVKRPG